MLLSKNLPQVSKKFTPIYLPYPRHYATLGEMLKNQLIEVHRLFLKVTQVWWIVEFQPIKFVDMIAGKGSHQYRKNTNNWYTTDALGAICSIFKYWPCWQRLKCCQCYLIGCAVTGPGHVLIFLVFMPVHLKTWRKWMVRIYFCTNWRAAFLQLHFITSAIFLPALCAMCMQEHL